MKNLKDLFNHQLQDLYSAESQLVDALPKMKEAATNEKLKKAFEDHYEETLKHKQRIEEICDKLDIDPNGEECKAMKGLIQEAEDFIKEEAPDDVKDAGLIAEAQRVEHYEISGYGTLINYCNQLGYEDIAEKLAKTLKQEYKADELLNDIAEDNINQKAK
ncbi:ferritin-like domain-containing protein [Leeuwenhoekiella aequorea]|uniref:YciE/YciF ferroxidase family protein n=1 Tax=Leeuwenhoekiella TaxID=283735 RepID=UPI00352EF9EB|tara:strand:- start:1606 stop:2088 length:483 start_codon:yes stop_codon:yes gene_type:complete